MWGFFRNFVVYKKRRERVPDVVIRKKVLTPNHQRNGKQENW